MRKGRLLIPALCLLLGACVLALPGAPPKLPPVGAASVAQDRVSCQRSGGAFTGTQGKAMLCFHTPPDAGRQCDRASQCTAGCLAKSHTCAPVTPLIGCQDVLDDEGRTVTQCVN